MVEELVDLDRRTRTPGALPPRLDRMRRAAHPRGPAPRIRGYTLREMGVDWQDSGVPMLDGTHCSPPAGAGPVASLLRARGAGPGVGNPRRDEQGGLDPEPWARAWERIDADFDAHLEAILSFLRRPTVSASDDDMLARRRAGRLFPCDGACGRSPRLHEGGRLADESYGREAQL